MFSEVLIKTILKVLIGNTFSKLYPFVILNLLAIYNGSEEVGAYAIFLSLANSGILFISGGLNSLLGRYLSIKDDEGIKKKKSALIFSLVFAMVMFALYIILIEIIYFFTDTLKVISNDVKYIVICVIIYIYGQACLALYKHALTGLRNYNKILNADMLISALSIGTLIFVLAFYPAFDLKVVIYLTTAIGFISGVIGCTGLYRCYSILNKKKFDINKADLTKEFISFSIPSLISSMMFTPILLLGKFVIEAHHGLETVGIFELSFQWATVVLMVTGVISTISLPDLANNIDSKFDFNRIYKKYILVSLSASAFLSISLIIAFLINEHTTFNYIPSNYEIELPILLMALASSVLISVWSIQVKVPAAYNMQLTATKINSIWVFFTLIGIYAFVPLYGALGFMISITLSWAILVIIYSSYNKKVNLAR